MIAGGSGRDRRPASTNTYPREAREGQNGPEAVRRRHTGTVVVSTRSEPEWGSPMDLVVMGFVLLGAVLYLLVLRQRFTGEEVAAVYSGTVVDRRVEEVALTTGARLDNLLVVRTEEDAVITVLVSPKVYGRFSVGDRIVKRAGARWPEPG